MYRRSPFFRISRWTARTVGHPTAVAAAVLIIVVRAFTGPLFRFSDTWQLVINTGTSVVTFLMVFLIQNTQNRDSEAVHLKLDEFIRATMGAHSTLLDLEEMEETDLDWLRDHDEATARRARHELEPERRDTGTPEISPNSGPCPPRGRWALPLRL